MEKTQSDQPEKCSKCNNFPEDILMLACGHDLCLLCAAKVFHKASEAKYTKQTNAILCELCGMSTHLDQSSVYELEKLLISTQIPLKQSIQPIQKPLKTPNRLKESFSVNSNPENTQRSLENTNRNLWTNSTPMLKAVKGFCPEHPDEEISYFCFNCLSNCICPECIIHGVHKNHEVMTIKKGYPIIKNKIDEFVKLLGLKIDDLKNGQDGLRSKKRDLFDHNKLVKRSIAEFFGELRNKIDIKEKEIIKSTDNTLEGNIKEIDKEIGDIEGNISVFFDELDLINNHLNAKDEALLLNFYSNQGKSIEKSLYSNEMPLQKPDLPCLIDLKELEQQISGLTDQIIGLNPVSMIDNMHSISKSPNKLFSNMKYSPISNKNDENGFENEKPSKNSNTYENRPPKGINRLTNSKTVLKPYNL